MDRGAEAERIIRESGEIKWCPVEGSKIAEFYKNKNIFLTGATGFLGKLLVEKLLRACPEINAIYILVRAKKGEDEMERVDKLYSDKVFAPLAKIQPKFQHKINLIKGDISLPNLGLSPEAISVINEKINVIFHSAATVKFDEKLSVATVINVRGTRDLLKIAQQCKNLESFVHISTAFANCNRSEIDEVFYKAPITADELIDLVEKTPEATLEEQTSRLTQDWPNTYAFTKAIAEEAVATHGKGLPLCIVRPSIIIATYKEPYIGWIDNMYGATGVVIGAGVGLLRVLHGDKERLAEIVPGDYVINSIIAASHKAAVEKNDIRIYNYVSSVENPHTWKEFTEQSRIWGIPIPTTRCVWYYSFRMQKNYYQFLLTFLFIQLLPALLMDFGMILMRRRPIMLKVYKKIYKFGSVIAYFTSRDWKFHNNNTQNLWNSITKADQQMFPFSMTEFDWSKFHKTHILGLRTHLIKDDISTLPQARIRWRRFFIAHIILKTVFYLLIFYIGFSIFMKILFA